VRLAAGRGVGAAGMAVAVLAIGLAGCTAPRNALGTSSSQCFRALAVAPAALHHEGRFAGVRYLSAANVAKAIEASTGEGRGLPAAIKANSAAVCAVRYRGSFTASGLAAEWPPGRRGGTLAVVVLVARSEKLLTTVLLDRRAPRSANLL
jgi:hypothetical protein